VSIKWTGLSALGLIGLVWVWDQRGRAASWTKRLGELALLGLIPAVIYLSAFWLHFRLLPLSGDGDAFMKTQFQATLINSQYYDPTVHLSFWDKFAQLNTEMFQANQTLTATHPYGSHWYTWPLEQRPIYYWQGEEQPNGKQGNIYLLGNPIIWWGIWAALIAGLSYAWLTRRQFRPRTVAGLALAGTAYAMNLIPFMSVARVMFLYHYFFSFCFSLIFVIILWNDLLTSKSGSLSRSRLQGLLVVLGLIVVGFLYFAPLTFGFPLTPEGLQARMWLHTWR
jgi:dolichyl-phosphate-mannose--protein O-mannosyl transferase